MFTGLVKTVKTAEGLKVRESSYLVVLFTLRETCITPSSSSVSYFKLDHHPGTARARLHTDYDNV